jgi:hypothetical protein
MVEHRRSLGARSLQQRAHYIAGLATLEGWLEAEQAQREAILDSETRWNEILKTIFMRREKLGR